MATVLKGIFLLTVIPVGPLGGAFSSGQNPNPSEPQTATSRKAPEKTPKERPLELLTLINNVRSAQPEFATDLLIGVAESARVTEPDWKKELLEEAFSMAADCQYHMPQRSVGPYPVDTRAGYLGEAFRLKLDTLSLRCRAVESMLRLDKAKALQLFSEIKNLRFSPVNCDGGLVYEVSDFYKTAAKLFREAFGAKEKQRGDHIQFLESLIDEISSPVQIPPAANLVRSLEMSREQRERLVSALASRLPKLSGDDRSFSSSIHSVDDEIARLMHACDKQGVSTRELMRSLRSYYVKHFSADRCADTLRNTGDTGKIPHQVSQFNKRVQAFTEKHVSEIELDDLQPSRIEGKVDVHFYWRSPRAQRLMHSFKQLKFGSGTKPLTKSEIDRVEWRADFSEFFKGLLAWDKNDENSVEDYFHQKCNLFEGLMSIPTETSEKDEVVREFVSFLWRFDLKSMSRIEWFWHAKNLLPRALGQQDREGSLNRRAVLESSSNPVLFIYAEAWKALASPANQNDEPGTGKPTRNP